MLVSPVLSSDARAKHSVYTLFGNNGFILLNMTKANAVVANSISSRRFSYLGKRTHLRKEYKVGGYKSDLFIEDTETVVEIKSILSFAEDKVVQFPSVYSQRAIDQLVKLSCLLDAGYNVSYIFVSLNPRIKWLAINEEIAEYRDAFRCCIKKGMKVKGVSLKLIDGEPIVYSSLPIST